MRNILLTVAAVTTLLALPVAAETLNGNNLNLVGSASMQNAELQLTGNADNQAGAAWLSSPLSTSRSFSVSYDFSLANAGKENMADGVAFVLQNKGVNAIGDGSAGSYLAYYGLDGVGSVVQTWYNNTAGLNINGDPSSTKKAPAQLGAARLVIGHEAVSYDAETHQLSMTGTLNVDGQVFPVSDSVSIDLAAKFGPSMYLGFTGATGAAFADQRITHFTYTAIPEQKTVPVAPPDTPAAAPEGKSYTLLILSLAVLAGLGLVIAIMLRRRASKD